MTDTPRRLLRAVHTFPRAAAIFSSIVALVVLVGWFAGLPTLTKLGAFGPPMAPSTAFMTLLTSIALWSRPATVAGRSRWLVRSCAFAVYAIAVLALVDSASSLEVDLERILPYVQRPWHAAPQTASAFILLASAMVSGNRRVRGVRPADLLALAAIAIATTALLGYVFDVPALYGTPREQPHIGMSVPAVLAILAIGIAYLVSDIEQSIVAILVAPDVGGVAARRLFAGALAFPPGAALLLLGPRLGWYSYSFGEATVLLLAVAEASAVILSTASRLSRADAALRASEAHVRQLVEQASDPIFLADLDGHFIDVNEAACRLIGYTRAELLDRRIVDIIAPEDLPRLEETRARLLAGAPSVVSERSMRRSDGIYVPVEINAKILSDGRWQAIARDITDRKRNEAVLERASETERSLRTWLQTIIDQLPNGVIVMDEHAQVKAMNRAVREMALPHAEQVDPWGNPAVFDIRDREQRPVPADQLPIIRALQTGETIRRGDLLLRQEDGRMLPIEAAAGPVRNEQGRITGAVVVVTDISERRETERLREEWIAVVAHDLRQPLNTILLWTDRLASLVNEERSSAAIERVRGGAWRLNRMIQDLLDAARLQANQLSVEPRAIDAVELARLTIDNAQLANPDAEIQLIAAPHELVWADGDRIQQVLANLVSNALKYGTPGTPVRIEITNREPMVEIGVINEGRVISAEERERLFSRFSRTQHARSAKIPGIGLGLYICKGLVEAHGGTIRVESGNGTVAFRFTLPRPPES